MEKHKRKVPIENILYMFSYIWDKVESLDKTMLDNDDNFTSSEIIGKLFLDNIRDVIRLGFYREYNLHNEELSGIKGKINFKDSLNHMSFQNAKAFCEYDEMEINNPINQIIKTTALKLYKLDDVKEETRREINRILLHLNQVDIVNLTNKSFNINFNRNNYYTYFIVMICKLIFELTMISENRGKYKFIDLLDDDKKMESIFELFVFKFYKKHLEKNSNTHEVKYQKQLDWGFSGGDQSWVPKMYLDILLYNRKESETIIIDTKYTRKFFTTKNIHSDAEVKKFHSTNMYQMFSYMNKLDGEHTKIKGVLLYPVPYSGEKVDERYETQIVNKENVATATMQIKTIDLSEKWNLIEEELLQIVKTENDKGMIVA